VASETVLKFERLFFLSFFCSFPQGVISGGRGRKTLEERLDAVIFVFMKELFKLLRCPVE
jgi:hypothetical protein